MENFARSVVWDIDVLTGYRWQIVANPLNANPQRRMTMLGTGLFADLRASRFDLLVNFGWAYPADWLAFALAHRRRIPFLLYGDTNIRDEWLFPGAPLRNATLAGLCRLSSGALYTGTFNRDFYIRHGIPPERLWFSPYAIDANRFRGRSREVARAKLGLRDEVCYFLFSGTLIPRKRPLSVVEAVAELQGKGQPAGVIFAGSGVLEGQLRQAIEAADLRHAHVLGFVNQEAIPDVYAAADALVLPSEKDPRATVVNEAMTAGIPVIISSSTGVWGPGDLVKHGREGFVFRLDEPERLAEYCEQLLNPYVRSRMGAAAAARAEWWSFDLAADGWVEAALALTGPNE